MTAEIIVGNKWGIAIAADSAVTVEQFYNGDIQRKVYNSANKLFMLSKYAPVGAMIYNSTTVGGVPWETIIKSVRADLAKKRFNTLREYAEFFFDRLDHDPRLFPEDSVRSVVWSNVFRLLLDLRSTSGNASDFRSRLDARLVQLEKADFIEGWGEATLKEVTTRYKGEINSAAKIAVPIASHRAGCTKKIERLVGLSFTKKERLRGYSGIVVCGFGDGEVFPRAEEFYTDIVVCGRVRRWRINTHQVGPEQPSIVIPFADTAVVRTITEGINPNYSTSLLRELIQILRALPGELFAPIKELTPEAKNAYAAAAIPAIISSLSSFNKKMLQVRDETHIDPIRKTIQVLPISELATVAETLINASQIHKRMNPDVESVGGPIDVAVISKGDGFVWIKRKHYFSPDLNPGFIRKYLDH